MPYGPAGDTTDVVAAFDGVAVEYGAVRKSTVVFDEPHRGVLMVTGADRLGFLNSMVTQRVIDLVPGLSRRSFWLSRKGRVEADLAVAGVEDGVMITLDRHLAGATALALNNYIFAEDAAVRDASEGLHRMSLHGATALATLAHRGEDPSLAGLERGHNAPCVISGVPVVADRDDLTGEPGIGLTMAREGAETVYDALVGPGAHPARPCGWFALNTARIEAGRALFNLDFGPNNLPAETGVMDSRVDFRKGCYLGQEVVARMHARKARKQCVVALRTLASTGSGADAGPGAGVEPPLPLCGDGVHTLDGPEGDRIGAVTSSTIAPMLGAAVVCFAMLRDAETAAGTVVLIRAEGGLIRAVVQEELSFWTG